MKRSLVVSLVASVSIAVIAFGATLGSGWSPKLGLDLAGGSEVVYKPAHPISSGEMDTTINVIRNRVDGARGVGGHGQLPGGQRRRAVPRGEEPRGPHQADRYDRAAVLPAGAVRGPSLQRAGEGQGPAERGAAGVRVVLPHEPDQPGGHPRQQRRPGVHAEQHPGRPAVRRLPVDPLGPGRRHQDGSAARGPGGGDPAVRALRTRPAPSSRGTPSPRRRGPSTRASASGW